MTESLTRIKHGFIDLIVLWKAVFFSKAKESYLKHCPASGFIKTLKILFFLCIFLLTGSEQLTAQTLTLENEHLYVEFQQSLPAVDHYVLKSNNQVIYGYLGSTGYGGEVFHDGSFYGLDMNVDSITKEGDSICYHNRGEFSSQQVVTFDICYTLSGNSVEWSFSNVQESPGYKLTFFRPPGVLTVRADQGGAKMVFPSGEGVLIDVATTTPGHSIAELGGWGRLPLGMLYHQGALAICTLDNLDMVLEEMVFDDPDKGRLGAIGTFFYYRIPPTNFELAGFVDVFDEYTTSLSAKLSFLSDYDQDGDIDWMDGAKFLRDQVQAVPEPKFLKSWITYIWRYGWEHIFKQLETVEKLYHLTDHNKINGILIGYNTGIPLIFGVEGDFDHGWASLEELRYVFETAEKSFNTFLGFYDNYIDYYPGTPGYDPALCIVNPDGTIMEGGSLPDYPGACVADAYEYAVQVGLERVRRTLSRYPIKEFHHLDAFHLYRGRDCSLESPSNGEEIRRGLNLIIDEFNKHGITTTGEVLTGYFVGPGTGWFLHTHALLVVDEEYLPFSGAEVIPLFVFIYHGKTLYGYGDVHYHEGGIPPDQFDIYSFLEPVLLGASSGSNVTWQPPDDLKIDQFYLIDLPWMALNQRFMEDYIVDGSYRKITYDDDTFVEIDYDSKTYTVQVDGRVIARDYTTFFPKNEKTFLIYSREAKTISEPLPDQWGNEMILLKLTENGINPSVPFHVTDGKITFQAEANTPYKLMKLNPLDKTPPTPNPMTWVTPPYQTGLNSITMVATTADDPTPPISYYFDFAGSPTGGLGGADSGWQSGTSYANSNLRANHKYGYRVKAKDGLNNHTAYSTTQYAYTAIQPPTGITFGTVTPTSIQARSTNTPTGLTWGSSGLLIENTTNATNSGWKRNNSPWTNKPLLPNTSYTFQAKARNGDGIETDYGPPASKYTRANLPGKASFSDGTRTSIRANWAANDNPPGTQYLCQNVTTKTDSGWITETSWISDNLACSTSYGFRVKAKNEEGIETGWTSLGSQYTVKCVLLLTPNGGEMIPSGSNYDIQWEATPVAESFDLYYSLNSGTTWNLIEKGVTEMSFPWLVPTPMSNKKGCLIKVVGYNVSGKVVGTDRSDKPFTIEVVKVKLPNGGEILQSGDTYTIEWEINGTKSPVTAVKLYYTVDGGTSWVLINTLDASATSYNWPVPTPTSNKKSCYVKVVAYSGNIIVGSDSSDKPFTIEGVRVIKPNGGEILKSGNPYELKWEINGTKYPVTTVKLYYTIDGGTSWVLINTLDASATSYNWPVPTPTSNKRSCYVKVVAYGGNIIVGSDSSDKPFTIEVTKLIQPNGGETLKSGDTYTIKWEVNGTKNPVTAVKLYYSTDGGSNWSLITTLDSSKTSYDWTPTVKATKTKCKVMVVLKDAKGNALGTDISDGYFTIQP